MDNAELIANLLPFIIFAVLLLVGYSAGTMAEKNHFKRLESREARTRGIPVTTMDDPPESGENVAKVELAMGSAVISVDYFKLVLSGLQNLIGGRVSAYESLVDRARREAILRMMESAPGADEFHNMRLETSRIGGSQRKKGVTCVEALAYGTAIWYRK